MRFITKILLGILLSVFTFPSYAANTAPKLAPIPEQIIPLGQVVIVQPVATDVDDDTLEYKVRYAPPSANINSHTGLFFWKPETLGTFKIGIVAKETNHDDEDNLSTQQIFNISVTSNSLVEFGLSRAGIEKIDEALIKTLPPEAFARFNELEVRRLAPSNFKVITPEQFAQFTSSAISGITPEQFRSLPGRHLNVLNAESMTGLTPQIIRMFKPEHFKSLNESEFRRLPSRKITHILMNVDRLRVAPKDVNYLLPSDWKMNDQNGKLAVPPGSRLTFKSLHSDRNISEKTQLPYGMPDLNSHLALGGETEDSVLSDLNGVLSEQKLSNFHFLQNATDGVVSARGGAQESGEVEYAMIPDARNIIQKADSEQVGLNISEDKKLELVTAQKQAFSMLPAPKDLTALEQLLGDEGSIEMRHNGEILLTYFDENTNNYQSRVVMFNYVVQQAEATSNERRARIDWPQRDAKNIRAIREGRVVYDDGSEQTMYATVVYPETLIGLLYGISGMDNVIYNADGSFSINLSGTDYLLISSDSYVSQQLDEGETITPSVSLKSSNELEYIVQDKEIMMTFTLMITSV